mmetsp:Transcript_2396/g.3313  ORF Transcript_2396/g.3313 Transcript_2396/m.3313 type:complete len:146 (-) Transcript_2396:109-546(-)
MENSHQAEVDGDADTRVRSGNVDGNGVDKKKRSEELFDEMEKEIKALEKLSNGGEEEKGGNIAEQTRELQKLFASMAHTEDAIFQICTGDLGIDEEDLAQTMKEISAKVETTEEEYSNEKHNAKNDDNDKNKTSSTTTTASKRAH